MKFLTKRTSETGKKLAAFQQKLIDQTRAQKALATELGFQKWSQWSFTGKIASVQFPEGHEVDIKLWKPSRDRKNFWTPRLTTKAGKELEKKFESSPGVHSTEINECVGYEEDGWENAGASFSNPEFIGFTIGDGFNGKLTLPEDCWEVTVSEYEKHFPKSED